MSNIAQVKEDYDRTAAAYNAGILEAPIGILESQLVKLAIGDATDKLVLDLGGGSGIHAREAIDAGAKRIDLVDLSPEMMRVARDTEKALGREGRIQFFEADVSKSLGHLPLEKYDIVMANWVFDHAGTVEIFEGMWRNVIAYLKPGGKFLGIRVSDPYSPLLQNTEFGITVKDLRQIPDGVAYTVVIHNDPVSEFETTSLKVSYSATSEFYEKQGLSEVEFIPPGRAEITKTNPGLWQEFIEKPFWVVVKAIKRPE